MMKAWLLKKIRDYFGFSQKETYGTVALMIILLLLLLIPWLHSLSLSNVIGDNQDKHLQDSIVGVLSQLKSTTSNQILSEDIDLSPFDPNQLSEEGWVSMGLNKNIAKRIAKYRSKGGKFRKKDDLLRVYDFPPDFYQAIEPYIVFGEVEKKNYKKRYFTEKREFAKNYDTSWKAKKRLNQIVQSVDINQADTAQLKKIRYIGEKRSLVILKYRDKLGGFTNKNQYKEIYGLDSMALGNLVQYTLIEPNSWKKISINYASAEELRIHPYIGYKLASLLVNYRLQHGKYTSIDDVSKIKILSSEQIEKLRPYLVYE